MTTYEPDTGPHQPDPKLIVRPHPGNPMGVRVDLVDFPESGGGVELDFGDGTARERMRRVGQHDSPVQHAYPSTGCYMITALGKKDRVIARQQVVVRGEVQVTGVSVASDEDGSIRVEFGHTADAADNLPLPHYRLEWPDGEHEHAWGVPGTVLRRDAPSGMHELRVVDLTSGRATRFPVDVPAAPSPDPDIEVGRDRGDPSGMTVVLRLLSVQPYPLHIWWDDADGPQVVQQPTEGMEIPHTYCWPGHYLQTVQYAGDPSFTRSMSTAARVPADQPLGAWRDDPRPYPAGNLLGPPYAAAVEDGLPAHGGRRDAVRARPVAVAGAVPPERLDPVTGVWEPPLDRGAEPHYPDGYPEHEHYPAVVADPYPDDELHAYRMAAREDFE